MYVLTMCVFAAAVAAAVAASWRLFLLIFLVLSCLVSTCIGIIPKTRVVSVAMIVTAVEPW